MATPYCPLRKSQRLQAAAERLNNDSRSGLSLLEQLPPELLTLILSKLDQTSLSRCAQLSRLWHCLATQPILWQKIHIYRSGADQDFSLTRRLRDWLGDRLVEIAACKLTFRHRLPLLLAASVNLTSLSLEYIHGDSAVKEAGRSCHQLRKLQIQYSRKALSVESLNSLLTGCPKLSVLEVSGIEVFTDWKDRQVRHLLCELVSRLTSLTTDDFVEAADVIMELPHCPRLQQLSMNEMSWSELDWLLRDLAPNLGELSVDVDALDMEDEAHLIRRFPTLASLRCLRLGHYHHDVGFAEMMLHLLPSLASLRKLQLTSFCAALTGLNYSKIVKCLPASMTELNLSFYSEFVTCYTGLELSTPLPPSLLRLELTGPVYAAGGMQLTEALAGCSGLTCLSLEVCSDDLLPALLAQLPRLRQLKLGEWSRLARQAWANLRCLATSPPDLKSFTVGQRFPCQAEPTGQFSLSDAAVADLCASPIAGGLRHLSLDQCETLTAAALASIADGCPLLASLSLFGFQPVVFDQSIEAAFDGRVDLSKCWSRP